MINRGGDLDIGGSTADEKIPQMEESGAGLRMRQWPSFCSNSSLCYCNGVFWDPHGVVGFGGEFVRAFDSVLLLKINC